MGKHFLVWLMALVFLPMAYPALVSPRTISGFIGQDYAAATALFGGKEQIDHDLIAIYKKNLSAVARFANEFRDLHDDSDKFRKSGDQIGEAIADIPHDWAESVKLQAYSTALRLVILSLWGTWLALPLAMGAMAGLLDRKLKFETFNPPIPPIYNTSAHLLLAFACMLLLWLICPIPIPLAIIPTVAVLVSVVISLAIANYPNY
ncbi:MAG: DUF4400 domain-containing protein [Methyloglobulus sp.]|nr:DUF4400 domain-containing protein [Methyloglobulus sp.]